MVSFKTFPGSPCLFPRLNSVYRMLLILLHAVPSPLHTENFIPLKVFFKCLAELIEEENAWLMNKCAIGLGEGGWKSEGWGTEAIKINGILYLLCFENVFSLIHFIGREKLEFILLNSTLFL